MWPTATCDKFLDANQNGIVQGVIFYFSHRDCCKAKKYFEGELDQHMFDQGKKERLVDM